VKTLLEDECSDYSELCNGYFLQKAWLQIDPHATHLPTSGQVTSQSRIKSLSLLLAHIRAFYENVLDQVLVLKLPDVINISLHCDEDLVASISTESPLISSHCASTHCDDIRTFLLLILGCAVQCEQKEVFIEQIKQLDIGTQHAIVECIQQITYNPESVFLVSEWSQPPAEEAEKDRLYLHFVGHINRLAKERDQLHQRVIDLSCELLNLTLSTTASVFSSSLKNLSSSNSSLNTNCDQKSHYLVELADVKSRLRRVQQELEEKSEAVVELKEVIEQNKEFCNKLRNQNLELTQEARTAKAYRDELDVLGERCRKVDRLEAEVQRYRDKMNELEFFKSRVEELREDNRILCETKTMLEEQLDSSRKRAEKLPELEEKILKLNAYGNEVNLQRELDRNQMERLIEEIAHLRQEKKSANDELARVQMELTDMRAQTHVDTESSKAKTEEGNLFDQISQDTTKRMIKLEHENQKLQNLLDDYRNNYVDLDSLSSLFDFYPKDVTSSSVADSETASTDSGFTSNRSKIEKLNDLKEHVDKLKAVQNSAKNLENVKLELEKEVIELKSKLHDEFNKSETIERNYSASCAENQKFQRIIESKNKKIEEYQSELMLLENENTKLAANAESLKLNLKKMNNLEVEMTNLEGDKHRLEQEKKSLDKEINRLKSSIEFKDQLIDENASKLSSLELEGKRLKRELDTANQLNAKLKEIEKENKDLANTVTVQKNTCTALQQDLVVEKLRAQKLADEFEKTLEALQEHGFADITTGSTSENLHQIVSRGVQLAIDKCLLPKETTIKELQGQLDQMTSVNSSMIDSLRRQLNLDEDATDKFSLNSLNELQQKITCLEDESKLLKVELNTQKELTNEVTVRSEHAESKLALTAERNSELQNENAKLQVENSLLKSQNGSLETQTEELQEQLELIKESIDKLKSKCEEFEENSRLLIRDNESLQEIHQQLTADYDNLTQSNSLLKQSYKALKAKNKSLEDELRSLNETHQQLIRKATEELECLKSKTSQGQVEDVNLKEKLVSLTEEHKVLNEELKRLQTEHKMLQNIYKNLRAENNELKLRHTELQGETAECKDRMNGLNVEVSKLSNYCEMVAVTNTTLETQRKRLATQSASLLSQYNDLLLELSSGCEKSVVDKLRELCLKKERLEKMFREYDISIEKSMPRVSGKDGHLSGKLTNTTLDDAIYGRLWEAETPSIDASPPHHHPLLSSTLLLRQYSLNNSANDKKKGPHDHLPSTPPRIPPRQHIPRTTLNIPAANSHEAVIEFTHGSGISKVQISSTGNSPLLSKASSVIAAGSPSTANFMRGNFKSNSVNYGNLMRRPVVGEAKLNGGIGVPSRLTSGIHSPQMFHLPPSRNVAVHLNSGGRTSSSSFVTQPHTATSPSVHSDSSTSHDSEKEIEVSVLNNNINNNSTTATAMMPNGNGRSRILVNGSTTATVEGSLKTSSQNITKADSERLSNAMNNNADESTSSTSNQNCTNQMATDSNSNSNNSNSIWYEYGCV
ncbi:PREDICTED: protein Daple-like, partial [Rhagoletis zephyria]|uniref:protein Daple-like n=1 Tax=Rhagoletis zephyria TaxID=28612 RepID=UPI0008117AE8